MALPLPSAFTELRKLFKWPDLSGSGLFSERIKNIMKTIQEIRTRLCRTWEIIEELEENKLYIFDNIKATPSVALKGIKKLDKSIKAERQECELLQWVLDVKKQG